MQEEIYMKLLAGLPLSIGSIDIFPLTLKEIAEMGDLEYQKYMFYIISSIEDLDIEDTIKEKLKDVSYWDLLTGNLYYNEDIGVCKALSIFTKENYIFNKDKFIFESENNIIDNETFNKIVEYIKLQNCIKKNEKKDFTPANKKAESIKKKIMAGRKALLEKQNKLTFTDIVSTVAAKCNGLNILNVWNLTIFQINNQLDRLQMVEEYDMAVKQALVGINVEAKKFQHYLRPIDFNKEE
jgi:glutamyl/glutaminyl-tRNA synthetase